MYPHLPPPAAPYPSANPLPPSSMSIQGQILEVTVVGCSRLKNTEWLSKQDPYVCLEYASTKYRTRTCTDGGRNPTFKEKFVFNLIEGLREISISVWNSNTFTVDEFIGKGRVQLQKVLSQGFDDTAWMIQSKSGKTAGEVTLIMHYQNAGKGHASASASAAAAATHAQPSYPAAYAPPPQAAPFPAGYPSPAGYPPAGPSYAPYPAAYPSPPPSYSPQPYPPPPHGAPQAHPPPTYPPPPGPYSTYPPHPY